MTEADSTTRPNSPDAIRDVARVLKGFHWWNYGMDEVCETYSDDWAWALARELLDKLTEAGWMPPPGQS